MSSNARHPSPLTGLLVNAAELLRRPGNWKDVEIDVESKHFEFEDPRLLPQLIGIHLHLECSNNGIVLSGNVSAQWHNQCCRCLKDISGVAVGEVGEIYQREITDPDAYRLESDQLNLAPMVREHVLLAVPDTPVCRPDCPGLCPVCGIDRSSPDGANCGCSQTPVDPRWDALRDLGSQFPQ